MDFRQFTQPGAARPTATEAPESEPRATRAASGKVKKLNWLQLSNGIMLVAIAVLVGLVVKATNHKSHRQPQFPQHSSRQFASPVPVTEASPRPPTVINVGHPLLGVTAGWELFARGPNEVVAIQMARGQVTETYVPALQSGNPEVSFVIGSDEVMVASADRVPGYLIPDGRPAQLLTGPFADGGPVAPSPKVDQFWVMTGTTRQPTASLVTRAGRQAGDTIRFSSKELPNTAVPDGRGYLLVIANPNYGVYDVGPTFANRMPVQVSAVGPSRWLALACRHPHCTNEVINPATGSHRTLPGPPLRNNAWSYPPLGVVSPDGSKAAVLASHSSKITLQLVNLQSGAVTPLDVPMDPSPSNECLAWSPDGKWLFIASAGGRLIAVEPRTGQIERLAVQLPYITQVAVRPAAG